MGVATVVVLRVAISVALEMERIVEVVILGWVATVVIVVEVIAVVLSVALVAVVFEVVAVVTAI